MSAGSPVCFPPLLVDGGEDAARVAVEAVGAAVVAYIGDELAGRGLHIDVCLRCDLAGHDHLARCDERLYGHVALRVAGQKLVEKIVADLVGDFVGVSLRHRFRREEKISIHFCLCVLS